MNTQARGSGFSRAAAVPLTPYRPGGRIGGIRRLAHILRFGLPFIRPYAGRFATGILLGVLFGVSNALILGATDLLIKRMSPAPATTLQAGATGLSGTPGVATTAPTPGRPALGSAESRVHGMLDPFLPRLGRPLDMAQVIGGLLLFPLLGALRGFVGYLSSYCLAWVSERVVNDLRLAVLGQLTRLSIDFFNRSTTGDLITRVTTDTAALQRCLNLGLSDLIKEPVTIISVFAGLCLIDWQLTLGAMVFFPFCVAPMIVLGRKVRKASKSGLRANISQSSLLVEMLGGIRIVKAFGLEEVQLERFREFTRQWFHFSMKGIRAKELVNPCIETISLLGFGAIVVFIASQQRTFADMAIFLTGIAFMYTPVKKLAALHILFEQTSVGVDRLAQILHEEPSVRDPARPVPLPQFHEAIEFRDVTFAYAGRPVLTNISFTVPKGSHLGIAGESGSGKSTLVNLLYRFHDPLQGAVCIDGNNIRDVSLQDLRAGMALVSQDIVLFDLTIAENIALGRPGASRAEIEQAARDAFAHDFITRLPQGYDTPIGERGVTLSGGQRQRLAIARAFVRNAPILVLDEATAALDSEAEAEVQAAIERLEQNRTVLCVAHRLSTLANMDRIIVLADGRIVESGSFQELLNQRGRFAAMAARQGLLPGP